MRLLRALLVTLPMIAACGGDDDPGEVAGVFPDEGFVGRKLTVEVTGDTTSWGAGSTVNFGDGITVDSVEVISPQALQVDISIDPAATIGAHDVTVTSGDTLTLPGAFNLISPIEVEVQLLEQGGFGAITITNLDLLNPFDTSTDPETGDFTGLTVASEDPNVTLSIADVSPDTVILSATADVTATTTGAITLTSTTEGVATVTRADPVAVTPRSPQVITVGTPANFTVAGNGSLLEITATSAGMLHIEMTTTDMMSADTPSFLLLPASGKFADTLAFHGNFTFFDGGRAALDNRIVSAGDKFFIVALERGFFGSPGYAATFEARIVDLTGVTAVADTGTNDTPDAAQALTGTIAQFDGSLADAADIDCFKITTAANKKIHVFTTDENNASDTVVSIFDGSLATSTELVVSDDADFGEDVITDTLVAPISRSICVAPSSFSAEGFTNAPYKAFVVIE